MRFLFLFLLLSVGFRSFAQAPGSTLFRHRNLEKAYEKGSRSNDGTPGAKYWQNRSIYNIEARLEPKTRRLNGVATIKYKNNSPDTLKNFIFKLAHDRYRKGSLRDFDVTPSDVTEEGVLITELKMNGTEVDLAKRRRGNTQLRLDLRSNPIAPGAETTFNVSWAYTLPAGEDAARECACDSTTFFIPYWYPEVAVYDDVHGWAQTPYSGQQEFYHDFSDYDVTITVPRGFHVWATGEWQNPEEIMEPIYVERWKRAHTSDEVSSIFSLKELQRGGIYKPQAQHRYRFKATDVPDFAFASTNHYNWDAVSVQVDDQSKRRTFISAVYDTASTDYREVARIAADGIRLMSTWLPGYPFPYPVMTVFNGNDGMEYPMMCNDVSTKPNSAMGLTVHEISHTYFPFMMGINEQEYAWMDEGWAAFFDYLLSDSLSNHKLGGVRNFSAIAGSDVDVPPMVRSSNLSSAYRNASYQRPSQAYFTLLDELGYETFHKCMKTYMDTWKGKHPIPYDFFYTWNRVSGQNLDWFWKPWFFEWSYPDLKLEPVAAKSGKKAQEIRVTRVGNLPVPVHAEVTYTDGSKQVFHERPSYWKNGATECRFTADKNKTVKSVKLGKTTIPDVTPKNNEY
jgi:hypothetical protein